MLNYCQPEDVAMRILRRKPNWFHGRPEIYLEGKEREFGKLKFDFIDEVIVYNIWISNRKDILDAATLAVWNFRKYADKILEIGD